MVGADGLDLQDIPGIAQRQQLDRLSELAAAEGLIHTGEQVVGIVLPRPCG